MADQTDIDSYHEGENTKYIAQRVTPIVHAEVEATDPALGSNILANDIRTTYDGYLAIRITVDEAVTLSVEEDVDATGSNARSQDMNDGNSVTAGAMQRFVFEARKKNGYNLQITGGTSPTVLVMEIFEHPLGGPV